MELNAAGYARLLRSCSAAKALPRGRQVHAHTAATGHDGIQILVNHLMNMYGKCGEVVHARALFDRMPKPDLFSWNIMIAVYSQAGDKEEEALILFRSMQSRGLKADKFTFSPALSACASLRSIVDGKHIHGLVIASSGVDDPPGFIVTNALLCMYGKCCCMRDAQIIFDGMHFRTTLSWNVMVAICARNGHGKRALEYFHRMVSTGVKPDKSTFLALLEACSSLASLDDGKYAHESLVASNLQSDVALATTLISMYGKCNSPEDARKVFDGMAEKNIVSWNAMIAAYVQTGHNCEALGVFRQMNRVGISPDRVTFISTLEACAGLESLEDGKAIHREIAKRGIELDFTLNNVLVNMYGKCGSLNDAWAIFKGIERPNVVTWTAMMAACYQNGQGEKALELFQKMESEGFKPNRVTFLTLVDACASLASVEAGRAAHKRIRREGGTPDIALETALINMYGKCGYLAEARAVFTDMRTQDVISWTAMIVAYAQHGRGKEALELFQEMVSKGFHPNAVTFLTILGACSHAGMLEEGRRYFASMSRDFGLKPLGKHYVCMMDLLGRAGHLDEAENLVLNMPVQDHVTAWMALLSACQTHCDVERGIRAAEQVFKLDPTNAAPYVLLSNIYAAAGRWDDVVKLRKRRMEVGVLKNP